MKLQFAAESWNGAKECCIEKCFVEEENPLFHLNTAEFVQDILRRRLDGEAPASLAWYFHAGLARMISAGAVRCREITGLETCALSGGVFQNTLLLELVLHELEQNGFNILRHRLVPPNDGGIALGQAAVAMDQLNKKD